MNLVFCKSDPLFCICKFLVVRNCKNNLSRIIHNELIELAHARCFMLDRKLKFSFF